MPGRSLEHRSDKNRETTSSVGEFYEFPAQAALEIAKEWIVAVAAKFISNGETRESGIERKNRSVTRKE